MTQEERLLAETDVFILDLDGTIYLGETLIDGAREFLDAIRGCGKQYLYFTNNSSRSAHACIEKLNRLGVAATPDEIMSSVDIILEQLQTAYQGKRVYLLGTPNLEAAFRAENIPLINEEDHTYRYEYGLTANGKVTKEEMPDIVVAGFDLTLNFEKLERACAYIRNGAAFFAIHPDITCPTEYGSIPDCGAIAAAITAATGISPRYFGKPFPETAAALQKRFALPLERIAFVGDRLYTDIEAGVAHGAKGFLVLTGEATREDLAHTSVCPSAVFPSVREMAKLLRAIQ